MATKANSFVLYAVAFSHTALYVGLQVLLSGLSVPRLVHQHILHDGAAAEKMYKADGAYGLVTGATDEIGEALVKELASRGWNLVLHGHSAARLQPLIDCLSAAYPVQTFLPLIADASRSLEELEFTQQLGSLKERHTVITLLINNSGCLPPVKPFAELSDAETVENIHVNVSFGVCLTRNLLAGGLFGAKSCVLNLGSIASIMKVPGTPTYSASKSFTSKFTASLQTQLLSPDPAFRSSYTSKIEILHLMPGGVRTKMTPIEATLLFLLDGKAFLVTPAAFAKAALGKIGLGEYYKSVYPCWRHELQMGVLTTFPEEGGSRAWVNGFLMRGVNGPRADGWKKLAAGWGMTDGKLVEPEKEVQLVDVE